MLTTGGHLPLAMTSFEARSTRTTASRPRRVPARRWMRRRRGLPARPLALGNTALRFVSFPANAVLVDEDLPAACSAARCSASGTTRGVRGERRRLEGVIGCTIAERSSVAGGRARVSTFGVALLLAAVLCDAVSVEHCSLPRRRAAPAHAAAAARLPGHGGRVGRHRRGSVAAAATRLDSPTRFVLLLSLYGATVHRRLRADRTRGSAARAARHAHQPRPPFARKGCRRRRLRRARPAAVVLHARAPKPEVVVVVDQTAAGRPRRRRSARRRRGAEADEGVNALG